MTLPWVRLADRGSTMEGPPLGAALLLSGGKIFRWEEPASSAFDCALMTIAIFVDADACPVKDEVYRVAQRYQIKVHVVANSVIRVPRGELVELVVVSPGFDAADDWIAKRAGESDIVVTSDIPLASRCLKAGATVIAPTGKAFTENSIGMALAMRDVMADLRAMGGVGGGPPPFSARDRSAFLQALDQAVTRAMRTEKSGPSR